MTTDTRREDLIGRLLMIGFEGRTFGPGIEKLLRDIRPGGIILFKRNVDAGVESLTALVSACQDLARSEFGRPLLVAIDQEGGPVKRLGLPFTQLPSQREMARRYPVDEVRVLAERSGRELAAVGINFNLSPVLDISTDPEAVYMVERTFGSDPEETAIFARAVIEGHLKHRVLTCGKHFPGIGDVHLDPHQDLPGVAHSAERIKGFEIIPFIRAMEAGLPAIMTSHVHYPSLDPVHPATFSVKIINGLLRETLGFNGLILTDDLEMGAVVKHYAMGPAAVTTTVAGSDLLLVCHRPDRIFEARSALIEAVKSGEIGMNRIEESIARQEAALSNTVQYPTGEPVGGGS